MIMRHVSLSFHNLCAGEEYTAASDISAGEATGSASRHGAQSRPRAPTRGRGKRLSARARLRQPWTSAGVAEAFDSRHELRARAPSPQASAHPLLAR